jgi:parvulin-like peptidyl-prolyl isomerase
MIIKPLTAGGAAIVLASMLFGLCAAALAQAPARAPASPPQVAPARPSGAPTQAAPAPAGAARPAETRSSGGEVIARVGTSDVTADEVRAVVAGLDARQQAALARDPALLSQAVRTMLANRLVLKEARAKKWDQQPEVAAQLERARESLLAESYLQSVTAPPDSFPSEAEIKAVYDANATAFLVPRQFQLAQITVTLAKDAEKTAEDKARKKLDELQKKLKQPSANFAALAKSESDDSDSAERGGEIGWLAEAQLRPEIRSQVVGLAMAAVTEPIRLDDGWHILKLLDTEASHTRPLGEVRDALVQRMRAERAEANRRAYVGELFKQSAPVINELALSKLLDPPAAESPR